MINLAAETLGLDGVTTVPDYLKLEVIHIELVDSVCLKVTAKNSEIVIDPRRVTSKPDIAVGYDGLGGSIELVWDSEMFNSRDTASSIADRKNINSLYRSLFFVAFDGEDMHLITRRPILSVPQGVTYTPIESGDIDFNRPRQWLSSLSDSMLALVVKNKAKRQLMSQLKPLDSLSALEKQVDLLSEIIVKIASGMEPGQQPEWLAEFSAGLESFSANKLIGGQAATAEVIAYKQGLRNLQATYLLQRSKTV